jgi:hypothetical protein
MPDDEYEPEEQLDDGDCEDILHDYFDPDLGDY